MQLKGRQGGGNVSSGKCAKKEADKVRRTISRTEQGTEEQNTMGATQGEDV